MVVRILGIKKSKTKNDKLAVNYFYATSFNQYDQDNADVNGVACGVQFTYTDYGIKVGDTVNLVYEPGYEGKATLVDIVPVRERFEVPSDIPFDEKTKGDKQTK